MILVVGLKIEYYYKTAGFGKNQVYNIKTFEVGDGAIKSTTIFIECLRMVSISSCPVSKPLRVCFC